MSKDNGVPAFPTSFTFDTGPLIKSADGMVVATERESFFQPGMTLRDYFAAKAMQGIWSVQGIDFGTYDNQARVSYEMADAMLRARE